MGFFSLFSFSNCVRLLFGAVHMGHQSFFTENSRLLLLEMMLVRVLMRLKQKSQAVQLYNQNKELKDVKDACRAEENSIWMIMICRIFTTSNPFDILHTPLIYCSCEMTDTCNFKSSK